MDKYIYWQKLVKKNPNLLAKNVIIKSEKIKAIVFNAFDVASGRSKEKSKPPPKTGFKPLDDIFSEFNN